MNTRTDMAHEALQRCPTLSGVEEENERKGRMRISRIRVRTQGAERKLDKPRGSYITLTLPEDGLSSKEVRQEAGRCLAAELSLLMGEVQSVLVVGLGNRHVTPDALGPQTIENLFVTRHVQNHFPDLLPPNTRTVAAFVAGVMGMTGVETAEAVTGIASVLEPDLIVAVDALASSESDHVGAMVQLNDTGISPGAGVGNFRMGLNKATLGNIVLRPGPNGRRGPVQQGQAAAGQRLPLHVRHAQGHRRHGEGRGQHPVLWAEFGAVRGELWSAGRAHAIIRFPHA